MYYSQDTSLAIYQYGVKGMKWGIRRTPEQLGHKVEKLTKQNRKLKEKAVVKGRVYEKKYENKANRYSAKSGKYAAKSGKYSSKASKYDYKSMKKEAFATSESDLKKAKKYKFKAAKYKVKADRANRLSGKYKVKEQKSLVKAGNYKLAAAKAEQRIYKNERLINSFNKTISSIESGKITQGESFFEQFFMQYERPDD